MEINWKTFIPKYHKLLDRGLSSGIGSRDGQMCVEAAVCAALGLPHGDEPHCVDPSVRAFKIALNDAAWSSPQARAQGLRRLGIAQVGSLGKIPPYEFAKRLTEKTTRVLLPTLFREVLADYPECLVAADRCEREGTCEAARSAETAAEAARAARAASTKTAEAVARAKADRYLILSANLAVETLVELQSPGCEYMDTDMQR